MERTLARGLRSTRAMEAARDEFGISAEAAWDLVAKVRDRWAKEAERDRPAARAELIAQVHELLDDAWEAGDRREVRYALGLLADIHGLRLRAVVVKDEGALSPEDRAAMEAVLAARPPASGTGG